MSVYPPTPSMSMIPGGADKRKAKRPPNVGSRELTSQENEMLFSLVGPDCVSLTAAVVQLLKSDRGTWRVDLAHGVVSLVKDYQQRAYCLRIYDILDERILWDFRLYKGFRVQNFPQCQKLLAFEQSELADGSIYGLNFHSAEESAEFKEHLDRRHAQERKSTTQIRPPQPPPMIYGTPNRNFEITQAYGGGGGGGTIRGTPMGLAPSHQQIGGITPLGTMAAHHTQIVHNDNSSSGGGSSWFGSKKDKNKKKDKKQRIKKEDISNPTNFQHKAHVGWNQDSGFSNKVYDDDMDEATRNILQAAGLETNNLNEDDKKFVKKFIAKNYDKYVSISAPLPETPKISRGAAPAFPSSQPYSAPPPPPPPPPARVESHGLAPARPPPPPPSSNGARRPLPQAPIDQSRPHCVPPPPPPPPPSSSSSAPPPPPPMPAGGIGGAAPPPPPPPPPPPAPGGAATLAALPAPQAGRSNLLAEIQAGKQLRSVAATPNSNTTNQSGDARGDVMAQIRQGAQLKHVDAAVEQERRKSSCVGGGAAGMGGLAGALAKALEERRMNMGIDDSSDEEEDEDDKNEWSD